MVPVFTFLLFVILYYNDRNFTITLNFPLRYLDYSFAIVAFVTLLLVSIDFDTEWKGIVLTGSSLISSFILPGWLIMRYLKIMRYVGFGSTLVLSFLFSIGFSSIIYLAIILVNEEVTAQFLSTVYVTIGIILILSNYIHKSRKYISEVQSKTSLDLLNLSTLAVLSVFVIFVIFSLYPTISIVPGLDIQRHYAEVEKLDQSPETFSSIYPWFHFSLAALNELTHLPMNIFQTIVSLLSIIMIYSFYYMSKAYLANENRYAHLIATIIFTTFSGFGWIYFLQQLPDKYGQLPPLDIYFDSKDATFSDIETGQSSELWFWFRPITVGFTILFILLYFLRIKNISKKLYISLTSFLLLILALVHLPELIVFSIIILAIAILVPRISLRLKEMSISIIVTFILYILFNILYQVLITKGGTIFYQDANSISFFIPVILIPVITLILLKYPRRFAPSLRLDKEIITSIVLFVYGSIIIYWLINYDEVSAVLNSISSLQGVSAVPTVIYPVFLGIAGIMAIPPAVILLTSMRRNPLILFPIIIITVFLFGKLISFIDISYTDLAYEERRLIPFLMSSVSVLASGLLIYLISLIKKISGHSKKLKFLKPISIGIIITFILLCGTLTTFINVNYWVLVNETQALTDNQINVLNSLSNIVDENTTLLSMSPISSSISDFIASYFTGWGSQYKFGLIKNQIWHSNSPEFPLSILGGLNKSAVIFLTADDVASPTFDQFRESYVISHLLGSYSKVYNNSMVVAKIPPLNPPSPNSDVVLVLSDLPYKKQNFAYDILSLGRFNYTTANIYDVPLIQKAKTIIAPNFEIATMISGCRSAYNFDFQKMIVLNLDGQDPVFKVNSEPLLNAMTNPNRTESTSLFDLSPYRYLTLKWYGTNSNQDYVLSLKLQDGKELSFDFKDSWNGWKEILFDINSNKERSSSDPLVIKRDQIGDNALGVSNISINTPQNDLVIPTNLIINNIGLVQNSELDSSKITSTTVEKDIEIPFNLSTLPVVTGSSFETSAEFDNGVPHS